MSKRGAPTLKVDSDIFFNRKKPGPQNNLSMYHDWPPNCILGKADLVYLQGIRELQPNFPE